MLILIVGRPNLLGIKVSMDQRTAAVSPWCDSAGTLLAQRLVRQWIHALRLFLGLLDVLTHFLREGENLGLVKSILSRGMEMCAQSMLQLLLPRCSMWKSGHYFHEPLALGSHLSTRRFRRRVFGSPR